MSGIPMSRLIPRSEWAVRTVVQSPMPMRPADHVFLHHAVSALEGSFIDLNNDGLSDSFVALLRQIENFHIDVRRWRGGIAYNGVVGHRGTRAEGRGPLIEGGATGGWADDRGLSICALGNYAGVHDVTPELLEAIALTIADWIEDGHLVPLRRLKILGHHQKPFATACPGDLTNRRRRIRRMVRAELRRRRLQRRLDDTRSKIQVLRVRAGRIREKLRG